LTAIAGFGAVLLVGCGQTTAETPVACLEGPQKITGALTSAPGPVRLDGDVPLSSCLARNQAEGEMANFGSDIVTVATELSLRIKSPGADSIAASIQGGYLVGALERGSEQSDGIHTALVDRVRNAVENGVDRIGRPARVHYQAGLVAGEEIG
jgi:hypothetical protein